MTKEQFLKLVKEPEIPIELWHEYFMETSGMPIPIDVFEKMFVEGMANQLVIRNTHGEIRRLSFKKAVDNFYDYYKRKFHLWEYEN